MDNLQQLITEGSRAARAVEAVVRAQSIGNRALSADERDRIARLARATLSASEAIESLVATTRSRDDEQLELERARFKFSGSLPFLQARAPSQTPASPHRADLRLAALAKRDAADRPQA